MSKTFIWPLLVPKYTFTQNCIRQKLHVTLVYIDNLLEIQKTYLLIIG